jgi:hypothetical protein
MSGSDLAVDPAVLRSAATTFDGAADVLAGLRAEAPLNDAATAVPSLRTAGACRGAATEVAAEVAAVIDNARRFGENLDAAARAYENRDQAGAGAIDNVNIPN